VKYLLAATAKASPLKRATTFGSPCATQKMFPTEWMSADIDSVDTWEVEGTCIIIELVVCVSVSVALGVSVALVDFDCEKEQIASAFLFQSRLSSRPACCVKVCVVLRVSVGLDEKVTPCVDDEVGELVCD